jgi:hypothetical protein
MRFVLAMVLAGLAALPLSASAHRALHHGRCDRRRSGVVRSRGSPEPVGTRLGRAITRKLGAVVLGYVDNDQRSRGDDRQRHRAGF